jgi:hypothetical protein
VFMKSSIAIQDQSEEFFVVRIDGRVNSSYRRFVDALKAGLQLRDQFPRHDIKVRAVTKGNHTVDEMQTTPAH